VFLAYIFRHSDRNDLIFFGYFKIISVYDRKINSVTLAKNDTTERTSMV